MSLRYLTHKIGKDIESEAMRLLCKLHDELAKSQPNKGQVENMLQDLDMLVSDYRRAEGEL